MEFYLIQIVHLGHLTIHVLQAKEDLKIICACLASNVGNKHYLKKIAMGGTASPDFPFPHHALLSRRPGFHLVQIVHLFYLLDV